MSHELPVEHSVPGIAPTYSGKVREIYDLGDEMIIVATDRLSTYDVILPDRIPGKGRLLTTLSTYWFAGLEDVVPTHFVSTDLSTFPEPFRGVEGLDGRSMRVMKAKRFDVECIVRGYLAGSGLREYAKSGTVCGIRLPEGLAPYAKLEEPIFTPTTKADTGHDENMTFEEMKSLVGTEEAETLRRLSIDIYRRASDHARERGVIIADTKFEFGERDGRVMLIDEVLTPDSSRFWDLEGYAPGTEPEPMDKQFARNAVDRTGWDHTPPAPKLPPEIVEELMRRYRAAVERITRGEERPRW
jgi:phosphoribosylaminoimidazole-succinocarboxamide synthase